MTEQMDKNLWRIGTSCPIDTDDIVLLHNCGKAGTMVIWQWSHQQANPDHALSAGVLATFNWKDDVPISMWEV